MSEIITCNKWLFSRDNEPFTEVHLPHTAFTEPDVINHPQSGKVHYRIVFHVPEAWQKKIVYMHIGAAMQRSEIYVNGIYQFTHFGGYQEFFIPLADNLVYEQDNTVDILLDNTSSCDMPPGKNISSLDFCYHSGLYRDAHLIVWNPVHITMPLAVSVTAGGGVFIRTESVETNGTANVIASCDMIHEFPAARRFELPDVSRGENNVSLRLKIYAPDGSVVFEEMSENAEVRPNCTHKFTFHAKIVNANLWSPENPVRYRSEWTLYYNGIESDVLNEHFGCRTISFTKDGFYLNGKKTFLNGTNRHMEYPFVGNAVPAGGQKRDAVLIKRAGFNFVRLCHYNQSPSFLEACDKLGIMVMPAIPGWQAYHANSSFLQNAFRDCRELVRSLRNRPSVILWEVSLNEAYPPAWFNEECHRIAHEEYPGDQCFTAGDTWGFFEGYDVLFPCDHLRSKDKPLLLREYGDWAFGGGSSTSRQSRGASVQNQIVQAWNFAWTFNRQRLEPGMIGCADWCFGDYNRGCDSWVETSGSVDLYRLPKLKYYFYQSQADGKPFIYAIHDGVSKLIVFSNCDAIELTRSGKFLGRQTPDNGPDTAYGKEGSPGWETALPGGFDQTGGEPFNGGCASQMKHPPFTFFNVEPPKPGEDIWLNGIIGKKKVTDFLVRKPGTPKKVKSRLRTEGVNPTVGDLIFVDAILLDDHDMIVPVSIPMKLELSGDAEIVGGMKTSEAGIASWLIRVKGKDFAVKKIHLQF